MLQIGCCLPAASFVPQLETKRSNFINTPEYVKNTMNILSDSGYSFGEMTVGSIANLSDKEYCDLKKVLSGTKIKVPVFNSFIPPSIPLAGPNVSNQAINEYLEHAMTRIKGVEGETIIFGSGGARSIPSDFSYREGEKQIIDFLCLCESYADKTGIIIALEPLNKKETNFINTVEEAVKLVIELQLPHIKVLADSYHMFMENESFDIIRQFPEYIFHIHIADKNRSYPGAIVENGVNFQSLFKVLKEISYARGVSVECKFNDFEIDSKKTYQYINKIIKNVGIDTNYLPFT